MLSKKGYKIIIVIAKLKIDLTSSLIIAADAIIFFFENWSKTHLVLINNNSTKKKYEEAIYNKNKFILYKYL